MAIIFSLDIDLIRWIIKSQVVMVLYCTYVLHTYAHFTVHTLECM